MENGIVNTSNKSINIDTFIENKRELVNNVIQNSFADLTRDLSFGDKILENFWLDYQILTVTKDSDNENVNKFYIKFINFLPTVFKNSIKEFIKLNYLEENKSNIDDFELEYDIFEVKHMELFTDKNIILFLRREDRLSTILNIFTTFDEYIIKSSQNLTSLLLGQTGSGKTTIAAITEGYFCSLNNEEPKERIISENGRGTKTFENIEIKIGDIVFNLSDFIGFGDAGYGFSDETVLNNLIDSLKENVLKSKDLDTIQYILNLDNCRLCYSDYKLLELFMRQMKESHNDLNYWKNVILVLTKGNQLFLNEYRKNGGLPKYEFNKYLSKRKEEGDLKNEEELREEYNDIYSELTKEAMFSWKEYITDRVYKKIDDGRLSASDDGQSFNVYFKKIAKELYPYYTNTMIDDIFKIISSNKVIAGTVEKDPNKESWDFRNCNIRPIPDFDFAIPFEEDEIHSIFPDYELIKNQCIYEKNWFNSLQNKINYCSKSHNFKLTVAKLNNMKIDENTENNNKVDFDQKTTDEIVKAAHAYKEVGCNIDPFWIFKAIWRFLSTYSA